MLIFRQLFDPDSSTYTYLLGDDVTREAILVDPVFEQVERDAALTRELGLRLVATLDTHVHADHVTGAWLHRQRSGSRIAISRASGAREADTLLDDGDRLSFGDRSLLALATPGHTHGCMTFVLDDESLALTGDCLLVRGCGRTDFQQGSAGELYRSIWSRIFSLPDQCLLYPGHDYRGLTVTSVAEERKFNPRLGGASSEGDFTGYMENLGLPHPRLIDIAVPANLACGRPGENRPAGAIPAWAPLTRAFAGFWEIQPEALAGVATRVQIVDVRDEPEIAEAGRIPGARAIALRDLAGRAGELDKSVPVVTVCRSGARSAQAATLLGKAGFADVANLAGGMLGYLVERPAP
jgi:sulfur dioxygenase